MLLRSCSNKNSVQVLVHVNHHGPTIKWISNQDQYKSVSSNKRRATIWSDGACATAAGPHKPPGSSGTFAQRLCWGCGLDATFWPVPCSFDLSHQQMLLSPETIPEVKKICIQAWQRACQVIKIQHIWTHNSLTCSASFSRCVYSFSNISKTFLHASSWYPPPVSAHRMRYGMRRMYSNTSLSQGRNQKISSSAAIESDR